MYLFEKKKNILGILFCSMFFYDLKCLVFLKVLKIMYYYIDICYDYCFEKLIVCVIC